MTTWSKILSSADSERRGAEEGNTVTLPLEVAGRGAVGEMSFQQLVPGIEHATNRPSCFVFSRFALLQYGAEFIPYCLRDVQFVNRRS